MVKALLFATPDSRSGFGEVAFIQNLGIASIAGNVDSGVCDIQVADLILLKGIVEDYVLGLLRKGIPDLVGLSCMSFQYHSAIKLAKLVKSYDKNIFVAIGGYHPTSMYREISASPESQFIDFIVRGEGEATFNELTAAMDAGGGYDKVAGLSYKANGVFYHNPPRDLLPLETIRIPKRDARLISKGFHAFGLPADVIETSRGCTHNCKFCSIRQMYGRSFRKYDISRVIMDITDAREHGAKYLVIADDNITLDLKRLEMLCEEIVAAKLNTIHYAVQCSVKGIAHSERLIQKMADAGIKLVFLGIENLSKSNLDFLGKTVASDDTIKAVKYLHDNGILSYGGLIVGNPDDDEEALWNTLNFAWALKLDAPGFIILTPHAKTKIREELIAGGLVTNADDFSTYHLEYANIRTRHLTPEEIERIVGDMYSAYYANLDYLRFNQIRRIYPSYFWKTAAKKSLLYLLDWMKKGIKGKMVKGEIDEKTGEIS